MCMSYIYFAVARASSVAMSRGSRNGNCAIYDDGFCSSSRLVGNIKRATRTIPTCRTIAYHRKSYSAVRTCDERTKHVQYIILYVDNI